MRRGRKRSRDEVKRASDPLQKKLGRDVEKEETVATGLPDVAGFPLGDQCRMVDPMRGVSPELLLDDRRVAGVEREAEIRAGNDRDVLPIADESFHPGHRIGDADLTEMPIFGARGERPVFDAHDVELAIRRDIHVLPELEAGMIVERRRQSVRCEDNSIRVAGGDLRRRCVDPLIHLALPAAARLR